MLSSRGAVVKAKSRSRSRKREPTEPWEKTRARIRVGGNPPQRVIGLGR